MSSPCTAEMNVRWHSVPFNRNIKKGRAYQSNGWLAAKVQRFSGSKYVMTVYGKEFIYGRTSTVEKYSRPAYENKNVTLTPVLSDTLSSECKWLGMSPAIQ